MKEMSPRKRLSWQLEESNSTKQYTVESQEGKILYFAREIYRALKRGNKILACGNGGSASDASHFVAELLGRLKVERGALAAVSLSADGSVLTAVGNDYGYENVFSRQVSGLARTGDVLLCLSTSGESRNVVEAAKAGDAAECIVLGLIGRDGGELKKYCEQSIVVNGYGSTARIQETHIFLIHAIIDLVDYQIKNNEEIDRINFESEQN